MPTKRGPIGPGRIRVPSRNGCDMGLPATSRTCDGSAVVAESVLLRAYDCAAELEAPALLNTEPRLTCRALDNAREGIVLRRQHLQPARRAEQRLRRDLLRPSHLSRGCGDVDRDALATDAHVRRRLSSVLHVAAGAVDDQRGVERLEEAVVTAVRASKVEPGHPLMVQQQRCRTTTGLLRGQK